MSVNSTQKIKPTLGMCYRRKFLLEVAVHIFELRK
jgi:hypothetical protein